MRAVALGRRWCADGVSAHDAERPIDLIEELLCRERRRVIDAAVHEVERVIDDGADLVCLPGSSLPATSEGPSRRLLELSKRATLVLETVSEHGPASERSAKGKRYGARQAWVLADGAVTCGPLGQLFAGSSELSSKQARAEKLGTLAHEITSGARTFPLPGGYLGLLLICGEMNAVRSTWAAGATWVPEVWRGEPASNELARWWAERDRVVVCNPTHTWMRPQAVWPKRRFLANKGAYLGPTNGYAFYGWPASNLAGSVCGCQSKPKCIVIDSAAAARAAYPPLVWRRETVDFPPHPSRLAC